MERKPPFPRHLKNQVHNKPTDFIMKIYKFLNRPLALEQSCVSFLTQEILAGRTQDLQSMATNPRDSPQVSEKICVIEIKGILVPGDIYWKGWVCGYDAIQEQLIQALNNDRIETIVLLVDSPGGIASGCFDLSDFIYKAREIKRIMAICDSNAYSAAYAIASAAHFITVPRDGGVGSIGVIAMHTDYSKYLDKEGIKVTQITYGAYKGEGDPSIPLTDGALGRIQADVNYLGEMFVETVARNRDLEPEKIRKMEAGTFLGSFGVGQGLADVVSSPFEAIIKLGK